MESPQNEDFHFGFSLVWIFKICCKKWLAIAKFQIKNERIFQILFPIINRPTNDVDRTILDQQYTNLCLENDTEDDEIQDEIEGREDEDDSYKINDIVTYVAQVVMSDLYLMMTASCGHSHGDSGDGKEEFEAESYEDESESESEEEISEESEEENQVTYKPYKKKKKKKPAHEKPQKEPHKKKKKKKKKKKEKPDHEKPHKKPHKKKKPHKHKPEHEEEHEHSYEEEKPEV